MTLDRETRNATAVVSRRTRRGGLTLIEVMVSGVLATLLILAIVKLMESVSKQRQFAQQVMDRNPPTELLEEQLRFDLMHARFFQVSRRQLRLQGWLARESAGGHPNWRHGEVVYQVETTASGPALVRYEKELSGVPRLSKHRSSLLWLGAESLKFTNLAVSLDETGGATTLSREKVPSGMRRLAPQVRLAVVAHDGRTICKLDVMHHMEFKN